MDREDIVTLFRDYCWMVKRRDHLWETIIDKRPLLRQKLVATYGIESVMPKSSGGISFAELEEMDKKEIKLFMKTDALSEKIEFIESTEQLFVSNLKLLTVRECMLEKKTDKEIADVLECSKSTAKRLRDEVIDTILRTEDLTEMKQMEQMNDLTKDLILK